MQLSPTLFFTGNAEEALEYYRAALGGGTTTIFRYKDAPPGMEDSVEFAEKVMYGSLATPFGTINAMDAPPERAGAPGSNFGISISSEDESAATHAFATLADGGQILMPYEQTFFAKKFGMTIDKFGTRWLISYMPADVSSQARS